jgi:hypothetical protein
VTGDVIKAYNRDTGWLATGVLGAVVLAALTLAVQERRPTATQAERDLLPNAYSATVERVVAKSSNSNGKMTSGPASSIDPTFTEPLCKKFLPRRWNTQLRLQFPLLPSLFKKIVTHLAKTQRKRQHQRSAM